jgi:hypothetical protein
MSKLLLSITVLSEFPIPKRLSSKTASGQRLIISNHIDLLTEKNSIQQSKTLPKKNDNPQIKPKLS